MSFSAAKLRGAFTALITPFNQDETVDFDALRALVRRQIEGGIDGLVPCGTTGESATMSEEERLEVIRTVVDEAKGQVPIVAGTGSNNTAQTIAFTKKVAAIDGVDAALVVTPYYNKPGQPELLRHYQAIADQGGLPLVLYNVPGRTGITFTVDTVAKLAEHENIIGIKEASADLIFDSAIKNAIPDDFALFSGDDFTTFPLIAIGGHGCISVVSNLVPGDMSRLCKAALNGDYETARSIHLAIQPLADALFKKSNPIPVKTAANLLGWCGPTLRGPLFEPDQDFKDALKRSLNDYGLSI